MAILELYSEIPPLSAELPYLGLRYIYVVTLPTYLGDLSTIFIEQPDYSRRVLIVARM